MTRLQKTAPYLVLLAACAVLLLLNAELLSMPPVWDATAGLFAPAIYLYISNYDLAGLLALAGYQAGGANVHSLDLMTHVTWLFIKLAEGDPGQFLPALHLLHGLFAAITVAATFCLARPFLATVPALLTAALVLVFPLFAVQASYVYSELPGAMCLAMGTLAWARRRFAWMLLWLALACGVKSFGLVLAAFLVFGLAFDRQLGLFRRIALVGLVLLIPFAIEFLKTRFGGGAVTGGAAVAIADHMHTVHAYLSSTPDLYGLVIVAILAPLVFAVRNRTLNPFALVARLASAGDADRYRLAIYLLPLGFLGFIVFVHFHSPGFFPLTRYYTWVMPMLVVGFAISLAWLIQLLTGLTRKPGTTGPVALSAALVVCVLAESLNRDGRFYPDHGTANRSFSKMERSFEYLDYFRIQQAALESAAQAANGRAIFVTRGEYYAGSIPMMGYVDRPLPSLVFVMHDPFYRARPRDWPSSFLVIDAFSNNFHGQRVINQVLEKARKRPEFRVRNVSRHESGPYRSAVWEVRRNRPKS